MTINRDSIFQLNWLAIEALLSVTERATRGPRGVRERVSQSVALRFAARLGWSKRHRGALMAARLRARAGADDARAASFYLARFACTSPHERIRAFTSGEDLIVCRFSLNQPALTVYKVRFSKCATPVRAARFTFQVSTRYLALLKAYASLKLGPFGPREPRQTLRRPSCAQFVRFSSVSDHK